MGRHILRYEVIERVVRDDRAERMCGEDDAVIAGWRVIGDQIKLRAKQTAHGLCALFKDLRACNEIGTEGVSAEVNGEISDGGGEKAIDEVGECGEGEVSSREKTKRQRRKGNTQMQPAESGFQLLMMVRGELFRLVHDGCRPMEQQESAARQDREMAGRRARGT